MFQDAYVNSVVFLLETMKCFKEYKSVHTHGIFHYSKAVCIPQLRAESALTVNQETTHAEAPLAATPNRNNEGAQGIDTRACY